MLGKDERGTPIEPKSARQRRRPRRDVHRGPGAQVDACQPAILALRKDSRALDRIDLTAAPVAAQDINPSGRGNAFAIARGGWPTPGAIFLQPAIDAIRLAHV